MMQTRTRKRQHRPGRELAGVREKRSPTRGGHETGRRYAKFARSTGTTKEDIMDTISVHENSKNTKDCSKTRQLEDITVNDNNAIEKAFPWLLEFNKIVCSSRGNRNYRHLKQLLLLYTQKVLSVKTSNVKLDPINLKNNINNILIFFHLYWLDIKQEIADHSLYLNKMSALLSVYIDMELRTSRQEIDLEKILAALYIYLNNSEEHIFRVLIRIKHMTEKRHIIRLISLKKKDTNKTEKIKKEPGEIIDIIDLTTEDDKISVYSKIERKKTKHNLECSQIKKNMKNEKHINPLKHSSGLVASVNIEKSSNRVSKSTVEKVCLEHKPTPNNKISDSIESSISNRSSLNNIYHINRQKSGHSNVIKNQVNNICPEFVKEDEKFDYNSHYLKSMFQYIKEFNDTTKVLKESKTENHHDVSHMTGNAIGSYNNTIMPSKETLISQEESVMDTPLSKMCQNDIVDQHFFKQEIPIIICNIIYNFPNIKEDIDITKLDCIEDPEKISFFNSIGITTKKLLAYTDNDITTIQDTLHMFNDNEIDIKSPNYTDISMLNDRDEYVYVTTNHVGERVMAKSAEKKMQYLDNSDICNKFNTDSVLKIDMDSKDDISFSHQIEILEILENVSNETMEFLRSPK